MLVLEMYGRLSVGRVQNAQVVVGAHSLANCRLQTQHPALLANRKANSPSETMERGHLQEQERCPVDQRAKGSFPCRHRRKWRSRHAPATLFHFQAGHM